MFLGLTLAVTSSAQTPEFRGIWVDAWGNGFFNSSQVSKLVSDCQTYNFNAVVVQMRRRGDAFYFPQAPNLEPRTTALSANYDALAELIRQCHNATPRIEVHCWVTTFVIWGDANNKPSQPGHVVNSHPEYLMQNSTGVQYIGEGYYLDPGHPGATLWNYNMAKDVVSHYDVDGFHWDYIRYPTTDSGYNPTAIARYNAEFGLSGQPSPSDTRFANWRRRQVTDFLRWTSADLLEIKTNLVISCSVFGSRSDAYNARYQDWSAWNSEGIIDICMPMGYTSDLDLFKSRCTDASNHQGVRRVYQGMGAYMNTKENTVAQLDYATETRNLLGTMFYSYRVPNSGTVNQTATFTYVRDNHQPTWVNTPSIPWKTAPTKGLLKGKLLRSDNLAGIYNATVGLSGASTRTQLSEVHGTFGFFELTPGAYTINVTTIGLGNLTTNVTVTAGSIVNLDLIIPVDDTTPPAISNVSASNISSDSATITWQTDESADSLVEYGDSLIYDSSESSDFLEQNHSVKLTGLTADTLYNFQVTSTDASGNEDSSQNFTFRTNPEGVVSDIIIDNPQATVVGSWTLTSFAPNRFGADYRFRSPGSGANHLKYTPTILTEGNYRVFEWHSHGSNRNTEAPHVITYNGGEETIYVDQMPASGGGKWNELGVFNFAAGTGGYVKITDGSPSAGVIIADAIKFVYVPYPPTAPGGLTATTVDSSQINLTWNDNSTNEENFIISRSLSASGPFEDVALLDADSTNYSDVELTESTQYFYHVRGSNAGGDSALSNQANATTRAGLPVIVTQPLSQTVTEGQNVEFFVVVRAKAPTYQWQFNGINIPGATGSSLNFTNVTGIHDGEYRVNVSNPFVVSNSLDAVLSDTAILRLNFFVTVATTLGGTYTSTPAQTGYAFNDALLVTAVATNGVFIGWSGDINDTNVTTTLVMNRNYNITAHFMPTSDLVVDNQQAIYTGSWTTSTASTEKYGNNFAYTASTPLAATAEAVYTPNIIYPGLYNVFIWYAAGGTRAPNVPVFISHQGGSASVTVNQTTNGGGWRQIATGKNFSAGTGGYVQVSNDTGETNKLIVADAFLFSLVNPPAIITQPQNITVNAGETATFSALASGTALTYQWRHRGTNIPGATGVSYTISDAKLSNAGNYELVLSNETGSLTSAVANLTVNVIPAQLNSMTRLPDKRFQFSLVGSPGDYIFEASTNLSSWVQLTNISTTNGVIKFIDNGSTNLPRRFYRTRQGP